MMKELKLVIKVKDFNLKKNCHKKYKALAPIATEILFFNLNPVRVLNPDRVKVKKKIEVKSGK